MRKARDLVVQLNRRNLASCYYLEKWCRHLSSMRGVERRKHNPVAIGAPQAVWERVLVDPSQWWDNRLKKKDPNYPDFVNMATREALWLQPQHALVKEKVRSGKTADSYTASFQWGANHGNSISKLCEEGELGEAVETLHNLLQRGCYISTSLFYRVLKRCTVKRDLTLGRRVHALTLQSGYESDTFMVNHVICMYASCGMLEEAIQVFSKVAAPDVYMWASIIMAHARHGQPTQAITLYQQMRDSIVKPDNRIFVATLKACASLADLASGKAVHADILGSAVELNIFIGNCLVDMYAKCGSLLDARRVFDNLPARDVVTWTAMIAGYVQHGLGQEALSLYEGMQKDDMNSANNVTFVCLLKACSLVGALHEGKQLHAQIQEKGLGADLAVGNCLVDMYAKCGSLVDARRVFDNLQARDVVTWNCMLAGYTQHGLGREALTLYESMQDEGFTTADQVTYLSLLKACASIGGLYEGKQLHAHIQEKGLDSDMVVGSCLVDMYAKCGSLGDARRVFDHLPTKDMVAWTAMISGYSQHGLGQEALSLYGSMQQECIAPADYVTFVSLLQACASVGALHQGKQLHAEVQQRGLEGDLVVGSCLVDMYAKCGSLVDARKVFDSLPKRDVVAWTALLNGYAQHSDGQMALQCFEEMRQQGIEPDDVSFICLLVACSHEGLVNEGQMYFESMKDCGIMPSLCHYNCLVDLLGRSGRLDESENILRTMPFQSDVVGWTALMSACKNYGDVERARRCFDRLITLEPGNSSHYVLLATLYATAGRWTEAHEVEALRKCAGAKKKPAKACIEVKHKVHEFTVGEGRADISSKLRSVNLRLKEEGGHVPQTQLVVKTVSEREKEDALCGHAEKLALAYGLLNTPNGETLVVTKNLRMCNDCHSGTKIMSRLEKREIIVRDAHRVHRFVDGSCSCGDRH